MKYLDYARRQLENVLLSVLDDVTEARERDSVLDVIDLTFFNLCNGIEAFLSRLNWANPDGERRRGLSSSRRRTFIVMPPLHG
jgi:hypothetical protein